MDTRHLVFADGFLQSILHGEKKITIRKGERDYVVGQQIVGECEGKSFVLRITGCDRYRLNDVPNQDLKADGFPSEVCALYALRRWYPELTLKSIVSVIKFERCGHVVIDIKRK